MTAGRLVHRRTLVLAALVAAIGAIVLTAFFVHQAGPSSARAADHLDAPGLTPPPGGDGIGTDLTDIYAFQSPADASKTVLIMNVNGLTTASTPMKRPRTSSTRMLRSISTILAASSPVPSSDIFVSR